VLRTRERAPIPFPSAFFTFGFIVESIKELGGVSSSHYNLQHIKKTTISLLIINFNELNQKDQRKKKIICFQCLFHNTTTIEEGNDIVAKPSKKAKVVTLAIFFATKPSKKAMEVVVFFFFTTTEPHNHRRR
jgi:hypothetical protein